jgi:RNA polymerase sigma factor (sigma-70 family)
VSYRDPEHELYLGILRRDGRSLQDLLERFAKPMMAIMWRRIYWFANDDDLQDLFQEAAIHIWYHIDRYDPNRPGTTFAKWVNQIAASTAAEYSRKALRRLKLMRERGGIFLSAEDDRDSEGWSAEMDQAGIRQHLHAAIAELSDSDREVVHLYLEGLSFREIGTRLNKNEGAVRTRLSRLRRKLAQLLEQSTWVPVGGSVAGE